MCGNITRYLREFEASFDASMNLCFEVGVMNLLREVKAFFA
jgi:hypothetical protein